MASFNKAFAYICIWFVTIFGGLYGCASSEESYVGNVYLGMLDKHAISDQSNTASEKPNASDSLLYQDNKMAIAMWYMDWEQPFPIKKAKELLEQRKIAHIVWEPWVWGDPESLKLKSIYKGEWDDYIREWAKSVAEFQYPVFIRFAPNFNVQDVSWSVFQNYKKPTNYKKAFQHVVNVFNQEGALNAIWVWSFMATDVPQKAWNQVQKAYPGDDYVDWIGVNGFNYGDINGQTWTDFETLFYERLKEVGRLYPHKPVMISEFGTVKSGGDKSQWLADIPDVLTSSFPEVKALIYKDSTDGIHNWSIDSTPSGKLAFENLTTHTLFHANIDDINDVSPVRQQPSIIRAADSDIEIDGTYFDWSDVTKHPLGNMEQVRQRVKHWDGPSDFDGNIAFSADEKRVYVLLEIDDDMVVTSNSNWRNNDRIVLYVSNQKGGQHAIKTMVLPINDNLFFVANGKEVKGAKRESTHIKHMSKIELMLPIKSLGFPFSTAKELFINVGYIDVDGDSSSVQNSSAHVLHGNKQFFYHTEHWPKVK